MKMFIYQAMRMFQDICMILSLFFSFRLINNRKVISYMRYFYWYSVVGGAIVLISYTSKNLGLPGEKGLQEIRNYSILFHFTFLSMFILSLVRYRKGFKILLSIYCMLILLILFYVVTYRGNTLNSASYPIANLGLTFYCIVYYYFLFKDAPKINLQKNPAFWVISGIFLGMSVTIPIHSLHEYFRKENYVDLENRKALASIAYFSYGVFHLFLVKAYSCAVYPQTI